MKRIRHKDHQVYWGQINRCYNPKSKDYKTYGSLGIEVEYTRKEFSAWFLKNIPKFKGKDPVVGRIDHSKNYRLDNIEIQSNIENIKERNQRCGNPALHKRRKVVVYLYPSMKKVTTTSSCAEAAKIANTFETSVSAICRGKHYSVRTGYTFRYASEVSKK